MTGGKVELSSRDTLQRANFSQVRSDRSHGPCTGRSLARNLPPRASGTPWPTSRTSFGRTPVPYPQQHGSPDSGPHQAGQELRRLWPGRPGAVEGDCQNAVPPASALHTRRAGAAVAKGGRVALYASLREPGRPRVCRASWPGARRRALGGGQLPGSWLLCGGLAQRYLESHARQQFGIRPHHSRLLGHAGVLVEGRRMGLHRWPRTARSRSAERPAGTVETRDWFKNTRSGSSRDTTATARRQYRTVQLLSFGLAGLKMLVQSRPVQRPFPGETAAQMSATARAHDAISQGRPIDDICAGEGKRAESLVAGWPLRGCWP